MFCAAEIPAEPLNDALVLPRSAIHEDNVVYVFEPDAASPGALSGRLGARSVPMLRSVGNEVLVDFTDRGEHERLPAARALARCELQAGDFVIVSPLPRPVVGMKLRRRLATASSADVGSDLFVSAPRVAPIELSFLLGRTPSAKVLCNSALRTVTAGVR